MEDEEKGGMPGTGGVSPDPLNPSAASPPSGVHGDFQRVDVERVESPGERQFGGQEMPGRVHVMFSSVSGDPLNMPKPPVLSTWICLFLAWFFLGSKVLFSVFVGLPLDAAALILALICLSRGAMVTGILVLLLGTVGSLIVYLVGLFRFFALG